MTLSVFSCPKCLPIRKKHWNDRILSGKYENKTKKTWWIKAHVGICSIPVYRTVLLTANYLHQKHTECLLKMHMPPSLQNRYLGRGSRAHILKIPHSQHWVILMHTGVWEPHPEPKAPLLTWCPSRTAGPGVSTAWGPEGTRSPGRDLGPKRHELYVNLQESQLSEPGFLLLEMEKLEFITHNIILGYYY